MAGESGSGEGVCGSVVAGAGATGWADYQGAESHRPRREVTHEKEEGGQAEGDGSFAGEERERGEDSGGREPDAWVGGGVEAAVGCRLIRLSFRHRCF